MTKPISRYKIPCRPEEYIQQLRCPSCHQKVLTSCYLMDLFYDNHQARWLAHLVNHYRQDHLSWWNNYWERYGGYYRGDWFGAYEVEKEKVNESSKRQIIQKGHKILLLNGIRPEDFLALQNTSEETMKVACKFLNPKI